MAHAAHIAALALAWLASSTDASTEPRVSATAIIHGANELRPRIRRAFDTTAALPIDLEFADLPNAPASKDDVRDIDAMMAKARAAYVQADFRRCLGDIGNDAVVRDLLARKHTTLAARMLFWRIACEFGARETQRAQDDARALAVMELDVPSDADAASPEVETLINKSARAIAATARVPLRIESTPSGLAVLVDGRADLCITPCTIDLYAGDHVVGVDGPSVVASFRLARAGTTPTSIAFDPNPAPPELAATKWTTRFANAADRDSIESLTLLATALRTRRLISIDAEARGANIALSSALVEDGRLVARSTRTTSTNDALPSEVHALVTDLLISGKLQAPPEPLYASAWFWIVVAGAAAAAATLATLIALEPNVKTEVRF